MLVRKDYSGFDLLNDALFNDFFVTPRNLKGRCATRFMETDILEKDDNYQIDINLPGFKKENIKIDFKDGYLTVEANQDEEKEEKKEEYIIKERYSGNLSRSFYVGDIDENLINASYENGILSIAIPKETKKQVENRKYIEIK